jgi:hypothetical protein
MHPRRRPAPVVVGGGGRGGGGVPCRRGSTEKAFPLRGRLVVPHGVVGRGGRSRRGGADRLPPPLRVRQRRRLRFRLPRLPPGSYHFSFLLRLLLVLMVAEDKDFPNLGVKFLLNLANWSSFFSQ